MLFHKSQCKVVDNSGAKVAECIKILGGSHKKVAQVGDIIIVSIQKLRNKSSRSRVTKGSIQKAIVLRTKKEYRRQNNTHYRFHENAIILFKKQGQPLSTRLFGPVLEDLRLVKDMKILSLASSYL